MVKKIQSLWILRFEKQLSGTFWIIVLKFSNIWSKYFKIISSFLFFLTWKSKCIILHSSAMNICQPFNQPMIGNWLKFKSKSSIHGFVRRYYILFYNLIILNIVTFVTYININIKKNYNWFIICKSLILSKPVLNYTP